MQELYYKAISAKVSFFGFLLASLEWSTLNSINETDGLVDFTIQLAGGIVLLLGSLYSLINGYKVEKKINKIKKEQSGQNISV
jgi:hypothetical protein